MAPQEAELFEDQHPLIRSCSALNEIRLAQDIKDLTIEVKNGDVLHVHRIVLAARIPSLRASLSGPPGEENSVLRWPTAPLSLANALVQYVYTGRVEMTQNNAMGMIALARMLELPALVNWGTTFLTKRVNLENLPATWDFAKTFNIKLLTDTCIGLMKEHFVEFVPTELFVRLPADTVLSVLRSDHLSVGSEEEVVAAIARWTGAGACGQADDEKLKVHAPEMLKEVQWQLTTARSRDRLMKDYPTFGKSPECLQLMLQVERWIGAADKEKLARPFNLRPRLRPTIFIFGPDRDGQDKWSVLRADQHLQQAERVADTKTRRWFASYSVVGESIFVVGGGWNGSGLVDVDEFLVREGRWRKRASLAVRRQQHAAAVVKVHAVEGEETVIGIFGGCFEEGGKWTRLASCEVYDVSRDRWHKLPDLPEKRAATTAACLPGDSRVFVFGGYDGSSWLASVVFCHLRADWRAKATSGRTADFWQPAAAMRTARSSLAATPFRGAILVAGGWDGQSAFTVVEMFSPPDAGNPLGQWTKLADMKQPRRLFTLLTSANAVFALGNGDAPKNTVETLTEPGGSADSDNDLTSWVWSSKSPVETLDAIDGAASVRIRDVEEYLQHLTLLFDRFQQFGVTLHPATSLEFLSHLIDSNGIRPIPSKVAAIRDFPPATSKRQLQRFLGSKHTFELTPAALTSFEQVKALLADATLLTHFHADAPISLMVDASNVAVGAVLQQSLPDSTVPLAFFSRKLSKAEFCYSTFGRELLSAYLTVRHFLHLLEGREFTIFTDNKPLTFAMHSHSDKLKPREIRQLDCISQFTSDIRHIDGSRNEVADALSRPSIAHLQLSPGIDLAEMAAEQRRVGSPCDEDVFGLQLQELPLTTGNGTILCDVSTSSHRPFVPPSLRRKVFSSLHNLSRPGSRATDKLVSDRFV
ncbi:hypothetical protein SprV_0702334500 [Sparganum proliferum]